MRKLLLVSIVVTLLCGVVIVTAPPLIQVACDQGSDTGSCDVVTALRGVIRLVDHESCQAENAPGSCTVTSVAGLDRK